MTASFDSNVLLPLYRAAREMPSADFPEYALGLIKPLLRFESAIWGSGLTDGQSVKVREAHLHEVDPKAVAEWTQINRRDKVIPILLSRPHETIQFHAPTLFADPSDLVMRDYVKRFGRESYLITCLHCEQPDFIHWISLYRPDADAQYSEQERFACESLMPHFYEAMCINRAVANPDSQKAEHGPTQAALAIATAQGQIHFAQDRFLRLMQSEWLQFDGRRLPDDLLSSLSDSRNGKFKGGRLLCTIEHSGDMLLLEARPRTQLDDLPPKRAEVAWLFAAGHSHKDIARQLAIAPSTVRNQLRAAYADLGICNKSQLLQAANPSAPRPASSCIAPPA